MLVGMEVVGARRVSAQVIVQLVGTRHHRQLLVLRHRTALRVVRASTVIRQAVTVWRAASTVLRGDMLTRLGVMRPRTALRAMLVGMEVVGARRVSAQVSVQLVGTRHHRQLLVHRHRSALRAMLVGSVRVRVPHVPALVTAP